MALDSSPIAVDIPPPPQPPSQAHHPHHHHHHNPLKRTHSQTIPTPPQSVRKRVNYGGASRLKVRAEDAAADAGGDVFGRPPPPKRRSTNKSKSRVTFRPQPISSSPTQDASPPPELPFAEPRGFKTPSPPAPAPKVLPAPKEDLENPFIVSAEEQKSSNASMFKLKAPRVPTEEQPTINYVYRGVRQTFTNPLYRAPTVTEASQLPLSHPEYSPPPNVAPRLLFPPGSTKDTVAASLAADAGPALRGWVPNIEGAGSGSDVDMDGGERPVRTRPIGHGRENAVRGENAPRGGGGENRMFGAMR